MSALFVLNAAVNAGLSAITLAGLLWRQRLWACVPFSLLLLMRIINHSLHLWSPDRWWTWRNVLFTDWLEALLVILIALDIGRRVFGHLPPGWRKLTLLYRVVLLGLLLWLLIEAPEVWHSQGIPQLRALRGLIGRVFYGSALLCAVFLALPLYYRLPLDPVHRDIVFGLGCFGLLVALADMHIWRQDFFLVALWPVLVFWAWMAWRPEEPSNLTPEVMRWLQPWRAKRLGL